MCNTVGGFGRCSVNIHAEKGGNVILLGRIPEKLEAQACTETPPPALLTVCPPYATQI
ncbi:MAG: hypothetical protein ACI4KM_06485 [Oscillospiraceae bacterium]